MAPSDQRIAVDVERCRCGSPQENRIKGIDMFILHGDTCRSSAPFPSRPGGSHCPWLVDHSTQVIEKTVGLSVFGRSCTMRVEAGLTCESARDAFRLLKKTPWGGPSISRLGTAHASRLCNVKTLSYLKLTATQGPA